MGTETSSQAMGDGETDGVATGIALAVAVASLAGLFAASDGSGPAHLLGSLWGAGLFGGLAYLVVRGLRGDIA